MLWLSVAPAALSAAGATMAGHDEVNFVAAVTVPAKVFASVHCRDIGQLYDYLSDKVGTLDGARAIETALVLRHIKQLASNQADDRHSYLRNGADLVQKTTSLGGTPIDSALFRGHPAQVPTPGICVKQRLLRPRLTRSELAQGK